MKNFPHFLAGENSLNAGANSESDEEGLLDRLRVQGLSIQGQLVHIGQALVEVKSIIARVEHTSDHLVEQLQDEFLSHVGRHKSVDSLMDTVEEVYQKVSHATKVLSGNTGQSDISSRSLQFSAPSFTEAISSVLNAVATLDPKSNGATANASSLIRGAPIELLGTKTDLEELNSAANKANDTLGAFAHRLEEAFHALDARSNQMVYQEV